MKKIAIIFPGVGYHKDKPLLYYSAKLARTAGYEVRDVVFQGIECDKSRLREPEIMMDLFRRVYSAAEQQLAAMELPGDAEYLFLSKSVGTAVACVYAEQAGLKLRHIFFSPVDRFPGSRNGIAFAGDKDPIADYGKVETICRESGTEFFRIQGGNHSLETGDVKTDLENLQQMMALVEKYIGQA